MTLVMANGLCYVHFHVFCFIIPFFALFVATALFLAPPRLADSRQAVPKLLMFV
jgi:hypothetical protein